MEELLPLFCFFGQKRAGFLRDGVPYRGRRVEPYKVVGCGVKPRRKVQGSEPLIRGSRAEPYKNVPVFTGNIISFKNKKINPLYSYNGSEWIL